MIDDIVAEMEDGEININETRLKDVIEHLDILQGAMDETQREIEAKETILNKFRDIAEKYKQQKAEDKRLQNDLALRAEYLGSNSDAVQSFFSNEYYEASSKKDDFEFLMDRVPHYYGVNLEELDLQETREQQVSYLLKAIKLAGLFTPDIDQDYALRWFKMYKHHNLTVASYNPTAPINAKMVFFKPSEAK